MGQEEYQELSSFLRRFIRRLKLLEGVEGLCLTAICALLLFALGPGIEQLKNLVPYAPLAYSILTAIVLLTALGWSLFRFLRRLSQERAALYIEQKQPRLRNNLINSLQLYPQVVGAENAQGFSSGMVLALLRTTRKQIGVEKVRMENLGAGKFSAKVGGWEKSLRYGAVTVPFTSPTYTAEAVDPPDIANVQLMFYPPAYTGLASVSVPEGNIEGLKGSTLRLDAVATKDIVKADIVMDDGKKIPLKIDGGKLQPNLVWFKAQSYRILVEYSYGFRNTPISYELRVKPDGFPTIDLLRPTEDLEINGDETLSLEYSARDDFGIGEIALISKVGDREEKISLQKEDAKRLILRDQYT